MNYKDFGRKAYRITYSGIIALDEQLMTVCCDKKKIYNTYAHKNYFINLNNCFYTGIIAKNITYYLSKDINK